VNDRVRQDLAKLGLDPGTAPKADVRATRPVRVDSYPLDSINILERTDRANGYGDIVFHKETEPTRVVTGFLYYEKQGGGVTRTGFLGIPEVRKVEEAIQRLAPGLSSNSPSAST
jgi:hypothetical protein